MFQDVDLRALAQLHGPERAFLSFYGPADEPGRVLDAREKAIRALVSGDADEAEHFEENLRLLRSALEDIPEGARSVCVFACWALDFVKRVPLPVEVEPIVRVGAAPYLRPLAELQDEREDYLVVTADNKATRIFQVTSAVPEEAEKVKGGVKNHVKVGGWSQQRYERRRDKQLLHYAKEVADVLDGLCRDGRFRRVVLVGSDETIREIEAVLPATVAGRVIGSKAVDLHAGDKAALEAAEGLYVEAERASEGALWERIKGEHLRGGLAAAGPEEVLTAATVGRVDRAIVTRDARLKATRCRDCENVAAGERETCGACGSASVFGVDLVDELARQLELTGAEIEFTDPIAGLTELGDVAALLRWDDRGPASSAGQDGGHG